MKVLGDGLSSESIAAAVESSELLVLNESRTGVKRKYPLPTEDPAAERTVHAAVFHSDASRAGVSAKFAVFGDVESVRFLRNLGTIYVCCDKATSRFKLFLYSC